FAIIAQPLYKLLEKDVSYKWKEYQQNTFETLIRYLMMAPILRYPDFKELFYLHTNTSGIGLRAVLA
ncbi:11060_t:CDS:1, partial [Dentiscutata heterogama]